MPPKKDLTSNTKSKKKTTSSNEVINFYTKMPSSLQPKYHNPSFHNHLIGLPFRILVCGNSGSMKSNLVCDLINRMSGTFGNIKIITKAQEPLYDFLKMKIPSSHLQVYEGIEHTPLLNEFEEDEEMKDCQHLVIFDDLVLEPKKIQDALITPYFIRGRKVAKGINTIYITQSYYMTPPTIRKNLTHIFLKKLSNNRDLSSILGEYNLGCDRNDLYNLYEEATNDQQSFLMCDMVAPPNKRFRKNYLDIVDLKQYESRMPKFSLEDGYDSDKSK